MTRPGPQFILLRRLLPVDHRHHGPRKNSPTQSVAAQLGRVEWYVVVVDVPDKDHLRERRPGTDTHSDQSPSQGPSPPLMEDPRPMPPVQSSPNKRKRTVRQYACKSVCRPAPRKRAKLTATPAPSRPFFAFGEPTGPLHRAVRPASQKNATAGPSTETLRPNAAATIQPPPVGRRPRKRRASISSDSHSSDATPPPTISELLSKKKAKGSASSKGRPSPKKKSRLISLGTIEISSSSEDDRPLRRLRTTPRQKAPLATDPNDIIDLCSDSDNATPPPQSSPLRTRTTNGVISILTSDEELDEERAESPMPFFAMPEEVFPADEKQSPYFGVGTPLSEVVAPASPSAGISQTQDTPTPSPAPKSPLTDIAQEQYWPAPSPIRTLAPESLPANVSPKQQHPPKPPPATPGRSVSMEITSRMFADRGPEVAEEEGRDPQPAAEDAPAQPQIPPKSQPNSSSSRPSSFSMKAKKLPPTPRPQSRTKSASRSRTAESSPLPTVSPASHSASSPSPKSTSLILFPMPESSSQPPTSTSRSTLSLLLPARLPTRPEGAGAVAGPRPRPKPVASRHVSAFYQPPSTHQSLQGYTATYSDNPVVPPMNSGLWFRRAMERVRGGVKGKGKGKAGFGQRKSGAGRKENARVMLKICVPPRERGRATPEEKVDVPAKEKMGSLEKQISLVEQIASARSSADDIITKAPVSLEDEGNSQLGIGLKVLYDAKKALTDDDDVKMDVVREEENSGPQASEASPALGSISDVEMTVEDEEKSYPTAPEPDSTVDVAIPIDDDNERHSPAPNPAPKSPPSLQELIAATTHSVAAKPPAQCTTPRSPLHVQEPVVAAHSFVAETLSNPMPASNRGAELEIDDEPIPEHVIKQSELLVSILSNFRSQAAAVATLERTADVHSPLGLRITQSSRSTPPTTVLPVYPSASVTTRINDTDRPPAITTSPEHIGQQPGAEESGPVPQGYQAARQHVLSPSTSLLRALSHSSRSSPPSSSKVSGSSSSIETCATTDDSPCPLTPPASGEMKVELLEIPIHYSAAPDVLLNLSALEAKYQVSDSDDDSDSLADLDLLYPEEMAT